MKLYEAHESNQVIDWVQDKLVDGESFYIVCEEHKAWCNEDTRFEEIETNVNICRWCSLQD